jgi:hypothetical protein
VAGGTRWVRDGRRVWKARWGVDVVSWLSNWQPDSTSAVDSLSDALQPDSKHGALGVRRSMEAPECVSRFTPESPFEQCRRNVSVWQVVATKERLVKAKIEQERV